MKNLLFLLLPMASLFWGCIGDDIIQDEVAETLQLTNPLDTLGVGDTYQLTAKFTNNVGEVEAKNVLWSSSDPGIVTVADGLLTGVAKGTTTISASVQLADETLTEGFVLVVDEETVAPPPPPGMRAGTIVTTSSYTLSGEFVITEIADGIRIDIGEEYEASTALPGLYVYLGNNPNTIANAFEIQKVETFDGAHFYEISGVGMDDYNYLLYWCKPFGVKVGEGVIE